MKNYEKFKEPLYLEYCDVNNLHGLTMSQKWSVNNFQWVEEKSWLNEDFIKIYNKDSNIGYFIEDHVQLPENLDKIHNDLPFLPERMETAKSKISCEKSA